MVSFTFSCKPPTQTFAVRRAGDKVDVEEEGRLEASRIFTDTLVDFIGSDIKSLVDSRGCLEVDCESLGGRDEEDTVVISGSTVEGGGSDIETLWGSCCVVI